MSVRRRSRELAVQMLFQWEMRHESPARIESGFWKHTSASDMTRKFANQLFEGAVGHRDSIELLLEKHSQGWQLDRIPAIDRAILRLAVWEIRGTGTPPNVAITQALEVARIYSAEDSLAYINAVLDAIEKEQQAASAKRA